MQKLLDNCTKNGESGATRATRATRGTTSDTGRESCTWMSRLDPNKKLEDITVPGSHDAGTYDIEVCSPWNAARTGPAAKWTRVARVFAPWIPHRYSRVQNLDLVDQFRKGVRYWDLRVAKHNTGESSPPDYRFTHGLLGGDFLKGVQDLVSYSARFPSEVLVLDIRFIWGFDFDDHLRFQNALLSMIGNRLATGSMFSPNSYLDDFVRSGKNIVVIYHSGDRVPDFWSKRRVASKWPNTTSADKAIRIFDEFAESADTFPENRLMGLHATLTPDGEYIAKHLFGSTQRLASSLNSKLISPTLGRWRGKFSFIMVDVVEHPGLCDAIIESNFGIKESKK